MVLVGNKADIDASAKYKYQRQVTVEEGVQFKEKHNLDFFIEVSAKSGDGISTIVETISKALYHSNKDHLFEFKESETASSVSYKSRYSSA